jgi:outer membrane receptor protein involved in Fe transport
VSKVKIFKDVSSWQYMDSSGSEDGIFFNNTDGVLDLWYRQFTPEEMGGLERGMVHSDQKTITITPGIKGHLGDNWGYEAYVNHSEYELKVSWPQIVASAANELFLGPQVGIDDDSGYASFDADVARLYTPLTREEFDSIATRTTYHPKSRTDYGSFTLTNAQLFQMPAGPVGFAANLEAGNQSYALEPDPLALEYYYVGWRDQDGHGSRNHWSGSYEFRVPLLETLELNTAGRYDNYHFAGNDTAEFTYNLGLEFRPIPSLLLRGYYGTGFRAPDLHYVFAGEGNVHPDGTDYFLCRTEEADEEIEDCTRAEEIIVETRSGNRELESETSKSWGAGLVWSPGDDFMVSLDYFSVELENKVLDLSTDQLLQDEADCRIGETRTGTPVDADSPTCVDAIARVVRYPLSSPTAPGELFGVRVNPINVAHETTDGVDLGVRWRLPVGASSFTFNGAWTKVFGHESQQYPGDPVVDQFRLDSDFVIPRSKASASVTFDTGPFSATVSARRLDRLTNYDEDARIPASIWTNFSTSYEFSEAASVRLTVDNLTDKKPVRDPTYSGYPFYDINWFDSVGRSFFLEIKYRFGAP